MDGGGDCAKGAERGMSIADFQFGQTSCVGGPDEVARTGQVDAERVRQTERGGMNVAARCRRRAMNLGLAVVLLGWCLPGAPALFADNAEQKSRHPLARAKVYLAAGDYRRAIEICQRHIDQSPSVESYVSLLYVYHALDGYVEWLARRDEWVKVGQLSLSLFTRGTEDLVDPPDMLPRMAKELLREGIRQHYDMVAGMANRLNKARADRLWLEVRAWQRARPDSWWAGVPEPWTW